jgi:cytochrome b subunit of formate dehydrogenase
MNKGKKITKWFLIALLLVIAIYDISIAYVFGGEATISRFTWYLALEFPAVGLSIVFGLGVLVGHLFVPQHVTDDKDYFKDV